MNQNEWLIKDTWTKGVGAGKFCGGTQEQHVEMAKKDLLEPCTCSGDGDPEYLCNRCSSEEWLQQGGSRKDQE